uniref:PH domain-containing protein n=1 Tax=Thermofilum pendens TaxID=2269 RepID=A0A7C3WJZ8_THEPE
MRGGSALSPSLLSYPERLLFVLAMISAPLALRQVAEPLLIPLLPASLTALAFGRLSRLQRLLTVLPYALAPWLELAPDAYTRVTLACALAGLVYLLLAWLDTRWTRYIFAPGEVRIHRIPLDELGLRERKEVVELESVKSVSVRNTLLSPLSKTYDLVLLTEHGEVVVKGVSQDFDLRSWLTARRLTAAPRRARPEPPEEARGEERLGPRKELLELRKELEAGSIDSVQVRLGGSEIRLEVEFRKPRPSLYTFIERAYNLALEISSALGLGAPELLAARAGRRIRTNRIERLL